MEPRRDQSQDAGSSAAMRSRLVRLRKEAGLNQAALAARLRITQSEVSKYERGERVLDERRMRAWLSALAPPLDAAALAFRSEQPALPVLTDPSGAAAAPRSFARRRSRDASATRPPRTAG